MIDFETVRFMKLLDELADMTSNDIVPFSKATQESWCSRQNLFFDDTAGEVEFPIVCEAVIDELHHDILSCYSGEDYTVRLICEEDEKPFIEVASVDQKYSIVIEDGTWYFA